MYIIPLTSEPDQTFTSTITVDNKNLTLNFRFRYNTEAEYWTMSILDYVEAIPLVGYENLLEQYSYKNIGSAYIVKNSSIEADRPSDTNLGTDFLLVWGDTV